MAVQKWNNNTKNNAVAFASSLNPQTKSVTDSVADKIVSNATANKTSGTSTYNSAFDKYKLLNLVPEQKEIVNNVPKNSYSTFNDWYEAATTPKTTLKTGSLKAAERFTEPLVDTSSFAPSAAYQQAMAYTNQLLEQLSSGRTSYTDQINALMDQINNREDFNYDPNTDTLFQNYLSGMMASGQQAMSDTMGQAAALTGGYGSSYATSAANQAYNSYVQGAYSNLDDYYGLALDQYNAEGQDLYNRLGSLQTADDVEYNRLANAYSANAQAAAQLYDNEYNNYWKQKSYDYQIARDEEEDYQARLKAISSGSSSSSKNVSNNMASQIQSYVSKYGADSDEVNGLIATFANQGYDVDELISYINTTPAKTYHIDMQTGKYVDEYGQTVDIPVKLYKDKNSNYYLDDYGNKYTKDQKKAIDKLQK